MDFTRFSNEQLQEARVYAAKPNLACANSAREDANYFADHITEAQKETYIQKELDYASKILAGNCDRNFTVRQRMYYYLTGQCVALLPN